MTSIFKNEVKETRKHKKVFNVIEVKCVCVLDSEMIF